MANEKKITDIVQSSHVDEHAHIYINDKYWITLPKNKILNYDLYKGKIIEPDLEKELTTIAGENKLWRRIYRYIYNRPHTKKQIKEYLKWKLKLSDLEIEKIIEKLGKKKLLSDKTFAEWHLTKRKTYGIHGKNKIKNELLQKGVGKELAEQVISSAYTNDDTSEREKIKRLVDKVGHTIKFKDPFDLKQKVISRLMSRGFNYNDIKEVFAEFDFKELAKEYSHNQKK